jgi:hypothetical protein
MLSELDALPPVRASRLAEGCETADYVIADMMGPRQPAGVASLTARAGARTRAWGDRRSLLSSLPRFSPYRDLPRHRFPKWAVRELRSILGVSLSALGGSNPWAFAVLDGTIQVHEAMLSVVDRVREHFDMCPSSPLGRMVCRRLDLFMNGSNPKWKESESELAIRWFTARAYLTLPPVLPALRKHPGRIFETVTYTSSRSASKGLAM